MGTPRVSISSFLLPELSVHGFCPTLSLGTPIDTEFGSTSLFIFLADMRGNRLIQTFQFSSGMWFYNRALKDFLGATPGFRENTNLSSPPDTTNLHSPFMEGFSSVFAMPLPSRLYLSSDRWDLHHWLENRSLRISKLRTLILYYHAVN